MGSGAAGPALGTQPKGSAFCLPHWSEPGLLRPSVHVQGLTTCCNLSSTQCGAGPECGFSSANSISVGMHFAGRFPLPLCFLIPLPTCKQAHTHIHVQVKMVPSSQAQWDLAGLASSLPWNCCHRHNSTPSLSAEANAFSTSYSIL